MKKPSCAVGEASDSGGKLLSRIQDGEIAMR
jgi:hypothetical protein